MDHSALAKCIDHTLLSPSATAAEVRRLCAVAHRFEVIAVCVSPSLVSVAVTALDELPDLDGGEILVATVCGFPSGAHRPEVKAAEAAQSVADGAHEIDMVIDLGNVKGSRWAEVQADIATVREAVPAPTVLKVIIESAALTDDEIVRCCEAAEAAGADFVKTSTGFHSTGGASLHAVQLMASTVGPRLGVKASGGIRDRAATLAMIDAGATRIGASATETILGAAEVRTSTSKHIDDRQGPR